MGQGQGSVGELQCEEGTHRRLFPFLGRTSLLC